MPDLGPPCGPSCAGLFCKVESDRCLKVCHPNYLARGFEAKVHDAAVARVDERFGYTLEQAPDILAHQYEYELEEIRIRENRGTR